MVRVGDTTSTQGNGLQRNYDWGIGLSAIRDGKVRNDQQRRMEEKKTQKIERMRDRIEQEEIE